MFKIVGLGLLAVANAVPRAVVYYRSQSQVKGNTVTSPDGTFDIGVGFGEPVRLVPNVPMLTIEVRDPQGLLQPSPEVGTIRTLEDYSQFSVLLLGLLDGYRYTINVASNVGYPCNFVPSSVSTTGQYTPADCIDSSGYNIYLNGATPGGNAGSVNTVEFIYVAGPLEGTISMVQDAVTDKPNHVRFQIDWNRQARPAMNEFGKPSGVVAVNRAGDALVVQDFIFGDLKWSFTVVGMNGDDVIVSLSDSQIAAFDIRGDANAASATGYSHSLRYSQDCKRVFVVDDTLTINYCNVAKFPENCQEQGDNGAAFVYLQGIMKVAKNSADSVEAMFGGAPCPDNGFESIVYEPCTCPRQDEVGVCEGRCDESNADVAEGECSCGADCYEFNNCCADVRYNCNANLPSCGSPNEDFVYPENSVQCGENAKDSNGRVLCYCDQWCTSDDSCCSNYEDGCFQGLCAMKAVGGNTFCTADYVQDQYIGCQCDKDCLAAGDCCRDFTVVCGGEPLCGAPANCNKMLGSSTGNWCMCDHACLEMKDCCRDYEQQCEVQATCTYRKKENGVEMTATQPTRRETFEDFGYSFDASQLTENWLDRYKSERVGKYLWTPQKFHLPAFGCGSVRFTSNDAWCSCDDECQYWQDCCKDYEQLCFNTGW